MGRDYRQYVTAIKSGDRTAFKAVYDEYFPKLYWFVLEFVHSETLAEDIVQDSFLALWNKRYELNAETNLVGWLFNTARNNCLYRLRTQRYRNSLFSSHTPDEAELKLDIEALNSFEPSYFDFEELSLIIEKTLNELPPQCKKVFMLSRFEGLKNREIAEGLQISVKVVEKHITKGLKIFKTALKDYLPLLAFLYY